MLILYELETRILNINYLVEQPDVTEAQKRPLLRLLAITENELLELYEAGQPRAIGSIYSRTTEGTISFHDGPPKYQLFLPRFDYKRSEVQVSISSR